MRYFFTILVIFLSSPVFSSGNYYFKHLKVEQGLSQSTVWCAMQDDKGFMWFGTKDGLNRYDGYNFKTYSDDSNVGLTTNFIRALYQSDDGKIWVGTSNGLFIYDPNLEKFEKFLISTDSKISIDAEVNDIKSDGLGNIWIAVNWQGLFKYSTSEKSLKFFTYIDNGRQNLLLNSWSLLVDDVDKNKLWIGTHGGGVIEMDTKSERFWQSDAEIKADIYKLAISGDDLLIGLANQGLMAYNRVHKTTRVIVKDLFVRDILPNYNGSIWIATESGIVIVDEKGSVRTLKHNSQDKFSISSNAVYCICKDRQDALWIGTYFGGVNYLPYNVKHFDKYYPNNLNNFTAIAPREFCEDSEGMLWIGSEDEGLFKFNPFTGIFTPYPQISYSNVHGLCLDGDRLYVGTFTDGVNVLDTRTGRVVKHFKSGTDDNTLSDNNVFSISKVGEDQIWFGTIYGLNIYDKKSDKIKRVKDLNSNIFVYDILQDSRGLVWVATYNDGLFCYNPTSDLWSQYKKDLNKPNSLPFNRVICIFEDNKGNMWFGTEGGGMSVYNVSNETFTSYSTRDILPNNVVYKILQDDQGRIWATTNRGLVGLDLETLKATVYTTQNGLLNDQFNYKSGIKSSSGLIYFGSIEGIVSFNPSLFTVDDHSTNVVITNLQISYEDIRVGDDKSPLNQSIIYTDEIDLSYEQSTLSFDFTSLNYNSSNKNHYAYKLVGYDKDWIEIPAYQRISYSHLPPGSYTLQIVAANSDGVWSDHIKELKINIHPPLWKTNTAYFLYCLIFLCLGALAFRMVRNRIRRINRDKIQSIKFANEQNLHRAKIEFFTTIAHEIRTPLTLIKAPFDKIVDGDLNYSVLRENKAIIESNINRLLLLVNQLMDFRKVENDGFELYCQSVDFKSVIDEVINQFKTTLDDKSIEISTDLADDLGDIFADREALIKIVSNLVANAAKFAESRIDISLCQSKDSVILRIDNDGKIIPFSSRESIFAPFSQVVSATSGNGTGLGLPIVRHLVELHNGRVYVDSSVEDVNSFVVELPVVSCGEAVTCGTNVDEFMDDGVSKAEVLVVEDDEELRNYTVKVLSAYYHVYSVSNGEEASREVFEHNIDVVVTDLVMPRMDGIELCRFIKQSDDLSHIAVIMVSGKCDVSSKIKGLESGVDAYLEKPFSDKHLVWQIKALIEQREKLRKTFVANPDVESRSLATNKSDEKFINKVTEVIMENISDEQFSVDRLASSLNMSRSSLHRKIKAIAQMSPNDFIRVTRLKRAALYLQSEDLSVGEVAFKVGFSSASYFTKCFKHQFGVLPKHTDSRKG